MDDKKPFLLLQSPEVPERRYALGNETLYLGRLPENHICIRDKASSRRHCKIERLGKHFRLVDLASSNGTIVNGIKTTDKILANGDRVQIGQFTLTFWDPMVPANPGSTDQTPSQNGLSPILQDPEKSQYLNQPDTGEARSYYLLYQIGRLLASTSDLEALLKAVLKQVFDHFDAQRGYIALVDKKTGGLIPGVSHFSDPVVEWAVPQIPSTTITGRAIQEKKALLTHDALSDPRFSAETSVASHTIRSVICCPLLIKNDMVGIIYLDHLNKARFFSEKNLELLVAIGHLIAVAIGQQDMREELQKQCLMRANLERFHSPDVVQSILKKTLKDGKLNREVTRREATILFSDIKGFTALSERISAEEIALLLNNYLNKMTQVVFRYRGTVNKYMGDAVMAIFGVPVVHGHTHPAELAIRAAIDMQKSLSRFLKQIAPHKRFMMRIGINTGEVVAGYIGADCHFEYTVLGDAVNTASRLENLCQPGQILIGQKTYQLTQKAFQFKPMGETQLKGKEKSLSTYEVLIPD